MKISGDLGSEVDFSYVYISYVYMLFKIKISHGHSLISMCNIWHWLGNGS